MKQLGVGPHPESQPESRNQPQGEKQHRKLGQGHQHHGEQNHRDQPAAETENDQHARQFDDLRNDVDIIAQIDSLKTDQDLRENPERENQRRTDSEAEETGPVISQLLRRGLFGVKQERDEEHRNSGSGQDQQRH